MVPDISKDVSLSFILHSDIAGGIRERTALHAYRVKVVNVTLRDVIQESKDNCRPCARTPGLSGGRKNPITEAAYGG